MSRDIAMQKKDMFKTNDRVSFLMIFFRLLQYYVFVVLFRDVFWPFRPALLLRLLHQGKEIEYQTFFAIKGRLAIIGRLLCLVAQILLLTFMMG